MKEDGLGIRKLCSFNHALLGKLLWRFGVERDHLCLRVIYVKYGEEWEGWTREWIRGSHGVSMWKSISRGWDSYQLLKI
jgi:hypothetical protein